MQFKGAGLASGVGSVLSVGWGAGLGGEKTASTCQR